MSDAKPKPLTSISMPPEQWTASMIEEQKQRILAAAGRRKNNPGYLERWDEGIAEYRRQIQEELERQLNEEEGK